MVYSFTCISDLKKFLVTNWLFETKKNLKNVKLKKNLNIQGILWHIFNWKLKKRKYSDFARHFFFVVGKHIPMSACKGAIIIDVAIVRYGNFVRRNTVSTELNSPRCFHKSIWSKNSLLIYRVSLSTNTVSTNVIFQFYFTKYLQSCFA